MPAAAAPELSLAGGGSPQRPAAPPGPPEQEEHTHSLAVPRQPHLPLCWAQRAGQGPVPPCIALHAAAPDPHSWCARCPGPQVNGKAGALGDDIKVARVKSILTITSNLDMSKRYLK